ncbi:glutathione S-transferase [Colwellia sp. MT41]|uniref:Glutathione S-transferase n=1 Tax=Colwellia marinimaniae TaxID=1513592 RepID=A0ABQ0MT70_9GAMM|nr:MULTISPECIES: glutathione S-transferase [Colwellia]ALO34077.1 glutathione S-transferase [Colwellia sp. MT41]GAW94826.1 glutathione S-transferase [Colwellia marinimaniae]
MNKSTNVIVSKNSNIIELPILYSLRNCPYAMRARLAIFKAKQAVLLRDLVLSNKPAEMIAVSPKGTVPVLVLTNGTVIEESLAIMLWALRATDPDDLLHRDEGGRKPSQQEGALAEMLLLINEFDTGFKTCLEAYKCAKRYQEDNIGQCREACQLYLEKLELRLSKHCYLISDKESLADIALIAFIRQFARIERQWYLQSPYPRVRQWLNSYLQSPVFTKVMAKYPLWLENRQDVLFGGN